MPNSFCTAAKIKPDRTSVHKFERLWRRDCGHGTARLRRADLEKGTLEKCEHLFGPLAEVNRQERGLELTVMEVNI